MEQKLNSQYLLSVAAVLKQAEDAYWNAAQNARHGDAVTYHNLRMRHDELLKLRIWMEVDGEWAAKAEAEKLSKVVTA